MGLCYRHAQHRHRHQVEHDRDSDTDADIGYGLIPMLACCGCKWQSHDVMVLLCVPSSAHSLMLHLMGIKVDATRPQIQIHLTCFTSIRK